jgi:hypothetical protein
MGNMPRTKEDFIKQGDKDGDSKISKSEFMGRKNSLETLIKKATVLSPLMRHLIPLHSVEAEEQHGATGRDARRQPGW